jgi:hypothetical protein
VKYRGFHTRKKKEDKTKTQEGARRAKEEDEESNTASEGSKLERKRGEKNASSLKNLSLFSTAFFFFGERW